MFDINWIFQEIRENLSKFRCIKAYLLTGWKIHFAVAECRIRIHLSKRYIVPY